MNLARACGPGSWLSSLARLRLPPEVELGPPVPSRRRLGDRAAELRTHGASVRTERSAAARLPGARPGGQASGPDLVSSRPGAPSPPARV
jgi:hypothetical protein